MVTLITHRDDIAGQDYTKEELLDAIGIPDDYATSESITPIRFYVPISDGMYEAKDSDESGTHYSLAVMEVSKPRDSNQVIVRAVHFNTFKTQGEKVRTDADLVQETTAELATKRIASLLNEDASYSFEEIEGIVQQPNGFSCGERTVFSATTLADHVPFGASE